MNFCTFTTDVEASEWAHKHYLSSVSFDYKCGLGQTIYKYNGSMYRATNRFLRGSPAYGSPEYGAMDKTEDKEAFEYILTASIFSIFLCM